MKLIDHYPPTLRWAYDLIAETVIDNGAASDTVDIAWYVTEWIRANWSRRILTPSWWGPAETRGEEGAELPGIKPAADRVKTERGRELRLVVWEIIVARAPETKQVCYLATAIARCVEDHWSKGRGVYIPHAACVDRAVRDAQVWRDFGGLSTIDRVIDVHQVSQNVIYTIFRRLQKDKDAREQPPLPGM